MNQEEALSAVQEYYDLMNPEKEDELRYVEALEYLIQETKKPWYMADLGWFYCKKKRFDLEFKYLEMAAKCGFGPACEELGYMWYYGQHGTKDYEKAFTYFTKGAEPDEYGNEGSLWCRYKLADMFRFGLAVEKDENKYRSMIEEAYEEVKKPENFSDPYPEICYRLAGIRVDEGKTEEAVLLLKSAKKFMAERLSKGAFWGHIEVMGRIVKLLYELIPFDETHFDFYDLFYLTKKPGVCSFKKAGKEYQITVSNVDGGFWFEGRRYVSWSEFCGEAEVGGDKFTAVYDGLYDWVWHDEESQ